jgi:hypothetical protein
VRQEIAALRDFNLAYVGSGSVATGAIEATIGACPLRPESDRWPQKRNPARGHPLAGLVQHSAGLHGVIAAQQPTVGLDRPTTPKVALALRSSVMTITKERIFTAELHRKKPAFLTVAILTHAITIGD